MKKDKIIFFIISTVLGVLIGFQFNTVDSVREANITPGKEGEKLILEIDKINEEKENLQEEIKERSKVLKKYEKNIMDKKTKELIDEVEKYKMLCGYEEVEGPGIIIDINDLHDDSLYYSDDQVLIEKKELLTFIVNILRMAGSEAISINDLRITAYTEIEVAGRHFEINGMSTNTPFSIKVIGDQNDLYKISNTLTDDEYFDIKIKKMRNITVPKFNKVIEFKDAEPIIEGTK